MPEPGTLGGSIVQYQYAEWLPLVAAVGLERSDEFMWLHQVRLVDGTRVEVYRHYESRRYLHLASGGRAYVYVAGELDLSADGYRPVPLQLALEAVLQTTTTSVSTSTT